MTSYKSQILGLLLAFATAIGCIFYERLAKVISYSSLMIIYGIELSLLYTIGGLFMGFSFKEDIQKMANKPVLMLFAFGYILTGITSVCWYLITKNQSVMAGSIYEVKYIVMMAFIYALVGQNKITGNLLIGLLLALASVYFVGKK